MNVQPLNVKPAQAFAALWEYKQHRALYDARDWEIERIYRAISKGKTVISVNSAIVNAGLDERGRPRLAICRADAQRCVFSTSNGETAVFGSADKTEWGGGTLRIEIPWRGIGHLSRAIARLPRIPPQHRPAQSKLKNYHLLWEADWSDIPRDPYLLRRIGKDAWAVLAAWDLTDVEVSVLRAHMDGRQ